MRRSWAHLPGLTLAVILAVSPGCKKRLKKSAAAGMITASDPRSKLYDQTLAQLRQVARACKTSLGRWTSICPAYQAFYRAHKPVFDDYKPDSIGAIMRLRAVMRAGLELLRSEAVHEQSVGAVVIGRGLYTMAWTRSAGRSAYRKALVHTYRTSGDGKLRYLMIDILCDDGGTAFFHGDAPIAELIIEAAGSDPDAQVRSEALGCIKYKVYRKRAPTASQLRQWFVKERDTHSNQLAVIEIAARLKLTPEVTDLCATYEKRRARKNSTCTAALVALGVQR